MVGEINRKQAKILGIKLDSTSKTQVLRFVRSRLARARSGTPFFIVTPNPEIIMRAQKDRKLAEILNSADLVLPDGTGLAQAAKFLSLSAPKPKIVRALVLLVQGALVGLATFFRRDWLFHSLNLIKGRELFLELCKLANKKGWRVFLLGGENGVADETKRVLKRNLKRIEIEVLGGPMLNLTANPASKKDKKIEDQAVSAINKFKPHLLFVAFGAPKQEKWLSKWLPKLDVGGAMTVGGTFNYLAGRSRFPPAQMEKIGLEWLWRLITEPWRFGRVLRAFPIFPLKIFWFKLNTP